MKTTTAIPHVRGKFLYAGDEKLYVRGATYGTFAPDANGDQFPPPDVVEHDFARMAWIGLNAVRTYTVPPRWLLDLALEHGLYVMVGLPWEAHVTFLDDRRTARGIEERVREGVRQVAGHPAILAYAIGNEIPATIARWHGRRATERFIRRLYDAAKAEDPDRLVTYVNYPTTEYLQLQFVDFLSFNVYLERRDDLEAYLARLHNLAGDRPLVMAEIGLDSRTNGEDVQATALEWQLGSAFGGGCAGAFVFAWTDEWHRGGHEIDDWDFGIVDRDRRAKRALGSVAAAFSRLHRVPAVDWPRISVVVCTHNGERWLPGCFAALDAVDYPDFEVVVVSDGSTDRTEDLARRPGVRLVATPDNRGLSAARNLGWQAASGEIVAYVDDDARPDPDWLRYLALTFMRTDHAAVGGPNIAPEGDGATAACVAKAPGGPTHVLLHDEVAEHIPGCNMAVRREALAAIGGFDEQFRIAGDDVDVCWRLQDAGHTIGFSPAAVVWHHRRGSIRLFLKQQRNYGKAEALLERKWPARYNRVGHLSWAGRVYAPMRRASDRRSKVGYGTWGSRLFQSIYEPATGVVASLPAMPEWYLVIAVLAALSALGLAWAPLLLAVPLLVAAVVAMLVRAVASAEAPGGLEFRGAPRRTRWRLRATVALLHLLQPLSRLRGRVRGGLTPWRRRCRGVPVLPARGAMAIWSERWSPLEGWLERIEALLAPDCVGVRRGSDYDRWDLELRGGPLGIVRVLCTLEEHGAGKQLARLRWWSKGSRIAALTAGVFAALAIGSAAGGLTLATVALGLVALGTAAVILYDCAIAAGVLERALRDVAAAPECSRVALRRRRGVAGALPSLRAGHLRLPRPRAPRVRVRLRVPRPALAGRVRLRRKEKRPSPWGFFRDLRHVRPYLRPHKRLAVASLSMVGVASLMQLLSPWPLAILVDTVLGDEPLPSLLGFLDGVDTYALLIIAVVAGLLVTGTEHGLAVADDYVNTKLDLSMVLDLRSDLFRHAQRLSMAYHDEKMTGQLMYQINMQASSLGTVTVAIPPLLTNLLTLIGMFLIVVKIQPQLALLALTVVPFIWWSAGYYARRIEPHVVRVRGMEGQSMSIVHEAMAMLRVVVAFGREAYEHRRFRAQAKDAVDARVGLTVRQTAFGLVVTMITATGTALVLGWGGHLVIQNSLSVGELLVVMGYVASIYKPLEQISTTVSMLQEQFIIMRGALELLETDPDIVEKPDAIAIERARGDVVFEDVSFNYEGRAGTLHDVSFVAAAGDRVAIVGPTGAGKSTLLSLIPRFYDPEEGRVLIDGLDLRDLKLDSLREQISIVHQEPLLFSGPVMENIRYGRLDATDEDVIEAAKAANAHEFIKELPQGYRTPIGERGAKLSGGERQRVAIARAFVKDAPILILDEPTSAIDSKTEAVILDALERLMEGRTTFMVAHRLSTVRQADLILVVNHGELVERGTHDELIAAGGLYRQLHDTQTGARRGAAAAEVDADELAELTTALAAQHTEGGNGNGKSHVGGRPVAQMARAMAEQELGDREDPEAAWLLLGAAWPLVEAGSTDRLRELAARRDDPAPAVAEAAAMAERLLADLALDAPDPAAIPEPVRR